MKYCLIFTFSLLLPTISYCQKQIGGRILKDDNSPAKFIQVSLLKADSTFLVASLTDSLGQYKFDSLKSGSYYISLGKIIYQEIEISENDQKISVEDTYVRKKEILLNEVKIKAFKNSIERDLDKLIVKIDDIILSKGRNAFELLSILPGIKYSPNGGLTVNGRGTPLFLIDGKPIGNNGKQSTSILSSMSAENIDKIEISTTPSSKYDSEGSGGIINIITKKNKSFSDIRTTIGGQLFPMKGISGSDFLTKGIGANFAFRLKKLNTNFTLDYTKSENIQNSRSERYFKDSKSIIENIRNLHTNSKSLSSRLVSSYEINKKISIDLSGSIIATIPSKSHSKESFYTLDSTTSSDLNLKTNLRIASINFGTSHTYTVSTRRTTCLIPEDYS